jgi:hypothetical protein
MLFGGTVAADRELDGARRIFMRRGAVRHGRAQRRAPRLAEFQGAVGIAMHKHTFNGNLVGPMLGHQRRYRLEDAPQPYHEVSAAHRNAATVHVAFPAGTAIDQPEAGTERSGIEPQYAAGRPRHQPRASRHPGLEIPPRPACSTPHAMTCRMPSLSE